MLEVAWEDKNFTSRALSQYSRRHSLEQPVQIAWSVILHANFIYFELVLKYLQLKSSQLQTIRRKDDRSTPVHSPTFCIVLVATYDL